MFTYVLCNDDIAKDSEEYMYFQGGKSGIGITPVKFISNSHWTCRDTLPQPSPSSVGPHRVENGAHPSRNPLYRVPSMTEQSFGGGTPAARGLRMPVWAEYLQ